MKPERPFIAARPLARHCAELLAPEEPRPDAAALFDRLASEMAAPLAARLAGLCAGSSPSTTAKPVRQCRVGELGFAQETNRVFSVIGLGVTQTPFLLALDAWAVFSLLDRAFGGNGTVSEPLPETFSMSADLFAARIEAAITDALARALSGVALTPIQRTRSMGEPRGLASDAELHVVTIDVNERERQSWSITLAFPAEAAAHLSAGQSSGKPARRPVRPANQPDAEPFGDVPLTLTARLVDMQIGFARLCDLKPGDILPVAVARSVPVRLNDTVIATGTIGELDDQVAIQITQAF